MDGDDAPLSRRMAKVNDRSGVAFVHLMAARRLAVVPT
jgi:hypothetical protein